MEYAVSRLDFIDFDFYFIYLPFILNESQGVK